MTDYIEQPAFETNEFKAGDEFVAYSAPKHRVFSMTVFSIKGDVVLSEDGASFHFKQCRLLKKREPRAFWIFEADIRPDAFGVRISQCEKPSNLTEWIKVREVLGDE